MKRYLSLVKFSHTVFAMPFAMIGFFLAVWYHHYPFHWTILILVILCMIFARNAAMSFNRLADHRIDTLNPRTRKREIPIGKVSLKSAMIFVWINSIAFIACTWFINPICFYLSPLALVLILAYSYTKRFTALSHFVLGLGLSLAPIGAYLSVSGQFHYLPVLYAFTVLTWVAGFDIIYALQDEYFDKENALHSIPVVLGGSKALRFSEMLHILSATTLLLAGYLAVFGWIYFLACFIFIALLFYQHRLVKPDELSKINLAFFTTNGIASMLFAFLMILDLWLHL